ncbi:MAG: DNA polymerase III subunit alpha, partial [Lachnospiraceae bacterium]|nr:DNA polymerase III subunit alpha [Lachnospiraceae bacterium]
MTSVKDFTAKVSEYILVCRRMGIPILTPDVNEGDGEFSVTYAKMPKKDGAGFEDVKAIRYGMSAIKSVGTSVIDEIIAERNERGKFTSLKDFLTRLSGVVNKRAVENFIKAGALDCFEGNRRQKMYAFPIVMDKAASDRKTQISGQMTLFDLLPEDEKKDFDMSLPKVTEFDSEELLAGEKEVLGVYVSGHPLEQYEDKLSKNATKVTTDFIYDDELKSTRVKDGEVAVVGGMVTELNIKYTKKSQTMAFVTLEDLVGTMEVIVFPRDYEKNKLRLSQDAKVFIKGHVQAEDEKNGRLIAEAVFGFDETKRELWIQFENESEYESREKELLELLADSDGKDPVIIYLSSVKQIKRLPMSKAVDADVTLKEKLFRTFGADNVKVVEKPLF